VVGLLRKKYGGEVGKRFGPTLAAEHLAEEDGIELGVVLSLSSCPVFIASDLSGFGFSSPAQI
jgi:hypothetical protein